MVRKGDALVMNRFETSVCKRGILTLAVALGQTMVLTPLAVLADGSVYVAGQTVFTNKAASGGLSADDRAQQVQKNLDNALVASKDRSPASVNIVYVKGMPVITLGGYQVVTVDAANAKAAGTTPALLAQKWADALRNSLRDTASVDSYIGQLSGNYASTAPASNAPQTSYNPPSNNNYQPQGGNSGGPGFGGPANGGGSDGGNGGPGNAGGGGYGGPPQGGYGGTAQANGYGQQGNNYGGPQGGGPQGGYGGPQGGYGGPQGQQGGYGQGGGSDQYNRSTYGGGGGAQRGRVMYAPAGLVMPVSLRTSISTQAAQSGDLIEAALTEPVNLGDSSIPAGAVLVGQITEAKAGGFLGRSGMLGIKFNRLRTPDGVETPISAHIQGGIGKYADTQGDVIHGETWKNKVGQVALRGALGAGAGAALGTAVGAIAGGSGRSTGRGAWSGTAIGGGVGVVDSLVLRKGRDVTIKGGTPMQVQLDAPMTVSGGGVPPYTGAF